MRLCPQLLELSILSLALGTQEVSSKGGAGEERKKKCWTGGRREGGKKGEREKKRKCWIESGREGGEQGDARVHAQ